MMTTEAPDGTTPASGKNRWFQLGLLSAGAAAPLIARWRSLRAAEQAESLREQASVRWSEAVARVAASLPTESLEGLEEGLRETLRQVAPQAQEGLRQVSSVARDAWQRLPGVSSPEPEPPAPVARRRGSATIWLLGVGVGVVAAGAVAYFVLRNRLSAASDDDTLVEIPLTSPAILATNGASPSAARAASAASATEATEEPAIIEEPSDEEPGVADPLPFSESDAEGAAFVGNILSRVYHPIDSKRLPSPQNRIYFASEAEALSAGYRPDSAELAQQASDIAETGE